MRKLFFLAASALISVAASAQCTELFISEYIEGWSNNKAIEIYNPTGAAIDMSDYRLERYSNGATSAQENQKVDLSGTIEPGDVLVYVLDKQDPDGVDFEAPVWDELAAVADVWLCPVYEENNAMYFNGNDAMVLRKISTNTPIDIFGKIGEDPGTTGWAEMTQNHTLIRKTSVTGGDTDGDNKLDEGETWTYECSTTIGAHSDGEEDPIVNTATASGTDEDGDALADAQDTHSLDITHDPGTLAISKSGPASAAHGDNVTFGHRDAGDRAGFRRTHDGLHLHRLDDEQRIALADHVAHTNVNAKDVARQYGCDRLT